MKILQGKCCCYYSKRFLSIPKTTIIGRIQPVKQQVKTVKNAPASPAKWKKVATEAGNWGLIAIGVGLVGAIGWALTEDLFGSSIEKNFYNQVSTLVLASDKAEAYYGKGLKASYGPPGTTRNRLAYSMDWMRGRQRHHLQFYITGQGQDKVGIVFATGYLAPSSKSITLSSLQIQDQQSGKSMEINVSSNPTLKRSRFGFY